MIEGLGGVAGLGEDQADVVEGRGHALEVAESTLELESLTVEPERWFRRAQLSVGEAEGAEGVGFGVFEAGLAKDWQDRF